MIVKIKHKNPRVLVFVTPHDVFDYVTKEFQKKSGDHPIFVKKVLSQS